MRRTRQMGKRPGHHLMICDYSGFCGWDDEMQKTWDGKWVLKEFWDPRHPQDFVRGKADDESVSPSRPEDTDRDVSDDYPNGVTANDL